MTPDRRRRAVLREFTDGVDLAELGREFQSETVLGKKETYRHQHVTRIINASGPQCRVHVCSSSSIGMATKPLMAL